MSWQGTIKNSPGIKFVLGMTYVDFKDLTRRTTFDNILRDKEINIFKNPK